jgi:DNA-binding winged helix-turn-helix (wHTH) protein/Tol biopolymer transport system component
LGVFTESLRFAEKMADPAQAAPDRRYCFGDFVLDCAARQLLRAGRSILLTPKEYDTLVVLIERSGQAVKKDDFIRAVWPDSFVGDASLARNISVLRKHLGPDSIETVPKHGYRFALPLSPAGDVVTGFKPSVKPPQTAQPVSPARGFFAASSAPGHRNRGQRQIASAAIAVAVTAAALLLVRFLLHQPGPSSRKLVQKRLTFNPTENPVNTSAISPDGKYLAYSDQDGIHIKLLSTYEERLIPKPARMPAGARWTIDSWFPDSAQLLTDASEPGGRQVIWTVSILGQSARELRDGAGGWEVSADGNLIAFSPHQGPSDYIREIWAMDSDGNAAHKILSVGQDESVDSVQWSPDGKHLAYVHARRLYTGELTAIETCALNGANRQTIVSNPALRPSFRWIAGGRIVYSLEDTRDLNYDNLWQIGVNNRSGSPVGRPEPITQWAGLKLGTMSASADGKLLAVQERTPRVQAYVAELERGNGRLANMRRLTSDDASDIPWSWTRDSKAILFTSDRNGPIGIFKQPITGGPVKPLVTGAQNADGPRLNPDGTLVLFRQFPVQPAEVDATLVNRHVSAWLMRTPVDGGLPIPIFQTSGGYRCARAPANICVIIDVSPDRSQMTLSAFDPIRGKRRVLRTVHKELSSGYASNLSPDGTMLAVADTTGAGSLISLISLTDAPDREIKLSGVSNVDTLEWAPDQKGFFLAWHFAESSALMYADLNGNTRTLWKDKGAVTGGIVSPNGRYIALLRVVTRSNVWLLRGF